jgi:hypothetical protein
MYRFEVEACNELTNKIEIAKGFVKGQNYGDAMRILSEWFGTTLIAVKLLYELNEVLEDDEIKEVIEE